MKIIKSKAAYLRLMLIMLMVLTVPLTLFSCKSKKGSEPSKVKTIDDLPGAVIGVQLGTTGDIFVSDYEKEGSTIERYNKAADAVQALKLGKIDCVVIDKAPADAFVKINPDLSILEENFAVEEYAICISKENPELREKLNSAIEKLKAMKKESTITEDDLKQAEKKMQDLTDKFCKKIDEECAAKEKEIMEI